MTKKYSVFLILPKIVDGKFTWLKSVWCIEKSEKIFIGDIETYRVVKEYHLK